MPDNIIKKKNRTFRFHEKCLVLTVLAINPERLKKGCAGPLVCDFRCVRVLGARASASVPAFVCMCVLCVHAHVLACVMCACTAPTPRKATKGPSQTSLPSVGLSFPKGKCRRFSCIRKSLETLSAPGPTGEPHFRRWKAPGPPTQQGPAPALPPPCVPPRPPSGSSKTPASPSSGP